MHILALETSCRQGSIAALVAENRDLQMVKVDWLPDSTRTAKSLAPRLRELFKLMGWQPATIGLVSVTCGPGSFTGLRIGVTAAKTLAYAIGAAVVGVDTLEVMAEQVPTECFPLWTVMDAGRDELLAAKFDCGPDGSLQTINPTQIVGRAAWLDSLGPGDHVTGPMLHRWSDALPDGVVTVEEELWRPSAATVGRMAWKRYQRGKVDDLWQLVPKYYRPSAAEEKWNARHGVE